MSLETASEEYKERIISEFERVHKDIEKLGEKIDTLKDGDISRMKVDIAMLQVKAGVWGLVGGLIPVVIMIIIEAMKK